MFNSLIVRQAARSGANRQPAPQCCVTHPRTLSDCQACQDVHCTARLGA